MAMSGQAAAGSSAAGTEEPCFQLIHLIREEILSCVDAVYNIDEMRTAGFELTVLRPLRDRLFTSHTPCLFFCLLFCRVGFLREAEDNVASSLLQLTRADVAELLCIRLATLYAAPTYDMTLIRVLTQEHDAMAGSERTMFHDKMSDHQWQDLLEDGWKASCSALELAIQSEAKAFIATPILQEVVDLIYKGSVTYLPAARTSFIEDNYKLRKAERYDPRTSPFLDHHRLRVPRIRVALESINFLIMLVLFMVFLGTQDSVKVSAWEIAFGLWSFGFLLDEACQFLNDTYYNSAWNWVDSMYSVIFISYLCLRLAGIQQHRDDLSLLSFKLLAASATVLLPRLAGSLISSNIVFMGLQSLFGQFFYFMGIATISCSGFVFALYILSDKLRSIREISWLLLRIWFGSSFLGFEVAEQYHHVFGPILMTIYASYTNILLITMLIAILSSSFDRVQKGATQELLFEKAVKTLERLKSDALLEYVPPANLLAVLFIFPLKYVLTPRYLHKVHVAFVKITSFPVLLFLAGLERLKTTTRYTNGIRLPDQISRMTSSRIESLAERLFERPVTSAAKPPPTPESSKLISHSPVASEVGMLDALHSLLPSLSMKKPKGSQADPDLAAKVETLQQTADGIQALLTKLLEQIKSDGR